MPGTEGRGDGTDRETREESRIVGERREGGGEGGGVSRAVQWTHVPFERLQSSNRLPAQPAHIHCLLNPHSLRSRRPNSVVNQPVPCLGQLPGYLDR